MRGGRRLNGAAADFIFSESVAAQNCARAAMDAPRQPGPRRADEPVEPAHKASAQPPFIAKAP